MKLTVFLVALVCLYGATVVTGQAVMSIDLGSEFLKVAIVKPGVPMEIVLNKESKRKTPSIVAMRNGEREFSDPALNTGVRFPPKAYRLVRDLLGKSYDHPIVERYRKWFPYHNIVKDEATGMPVFVADENTRYTPEELMAMIIEHAKHCADVFAENKMKDVVITVPPYFTQAERRALVRSTQLAGLNLLQLMSDNAAVALNYGIFRRKEFNNVTQHFMFYDMGSSGTTATIVGYQMVRMKVGGMMETNPQLVIKGVGFDSSLGGLEMTLRLRDHLAAEFTRMKKTKSDVYANERAMAKLWKEAERLKQILSANTEYMSQVEGLLDDEDFRVRVTRDQFEDLCSDLFERLMNPVADALKFSQVTTQEIYEVILMGGATRMPRVQQALQAFLKREDLGKSINTDEAAALGAVYQAAHLTVGFKVKTFVVKEAVIYPVVVEFDKHATSEDSPSKVVKRTLFGHMNPFPQKKVEFDKHATSEDSPSKVVKRTLFGHMNPFPQKKVMTFNKHTADFSFNLSYGDLSHLNEQHKKSFSHHRLSSVNLNGVGASFEKNSEGTESKGVKAHFRMDESGLLHLDLVESVFEKAPSETDENPSTWSKIGDALGGLFGSTPADEEKTNKTESSNETKTADDKESKKKEKSTKVDVETESKTDKPKDGEKDEKKETKAKDTKDSKDKDSKGKDTKDKDSKDKDTKDAKANTTSDKNDTKKDEPKEKPKPTIVRENITTTEKVLDMNDPSADSRKESTKKLSDLRKRDQTKMELEQARNDLEGFIYDMQDKLTHDAYVKCSTDKEREELTEMIREADDWQYEQTADTTKEVFTDKLKALQKKTSTLVLRVAEYVGREKNILDLRGMIFHGRNFSKTVKNLTILDPEIVTEVEMTTLDKLVNDTETWLNTSLLQLEAKPLHEDPVITRENFVQKGADISREIQYLVTKIMSYKRKPPKTAEKTNATLNNSTKKGEKKAEKKKSGAGSKSDSNDSNAKTLEDLENIPGLKILRSEDFMKDGEIDKDYLDNILKTDKGKSPKKDDTTDEPEETLTIGDGEDDIKTDTKTDDTKADEDIKISDETEDDETTTPRADL